MTRRRDLLAMGTGVLSVGAASPTFASPVRHADAHLLAIVEAIFRERAIVDFLEDQADAAHDQAAKIRLRAEVSKVVGREWDLRIELAKTRAHSVDGLRAKARVIRAYSDCAEGYARSDDDDAVAWSLANDLLGIDSAFADEAEGGAA